MKAFKTWALVIGLCFGGITVEAQDLSGLAKVDPATSQITDTWGGMKLSLNLSQAVPYRVFTLTEPNRLVLDFREATWAGVTSDTLLNADAALSVQFGPLRPGWSRLVVELAKPLEVERVGLSGPDDRASRVLTVRMGSTDQDSFDAIAGAPVDSDWMFQPAVQTPAPKKDDQLVIVLDPGHGGLDPGAEVDGYRESDLILQFAKDLQDRLLRQTSFDVHLTRSEDVFVPLESRITAAHDAQADLFLSLHADVVATGVAAGATAYTLSDEASDASSARIAAWHDRTDLIAGVDLSGQDDRIATVLMELARLDTDPKSDKFADLLVETLTDEGARVHKKPRRVADFAVLKSPDVPSVLLEVGFMSDPQDLANLLDPQARDIIIQGIVQAIQRWADETEADAALIRQ